ncbi:hypothetical protein D3C81_1789990 [compost metagenome]
MRIDLFRQVDTHVGVVLVTESPDCPAHRTGRRCIRAATPATQPLVNQQSGARIAVEAEPIGEVPSTALLFQALLTGFEFCQSGVQSRCRNGCCVRGDGLQGRRRAFDLLQFLGKCLGLLFGRGCTLFRCAGTRFKCGHAIFQCRALRSRRRCAEHADQ